jgi:nitroimidazol reductase NimA-like FMN-containing flavoprotein (pyridoxamine 5'-phosphate oxidase superfamily)
MRRKDRERDGAFALGVIERCEYASIATVCPDGTPYCVVVSPVVCGGAIYFHCAPEGKKLDNIRRNPGVCIAAVTGSRIIPEKFGAEFESAVADGVCEIVEDRAEKIAALTALCAKYAPEHLERAVAIIEKSIDGTCICRITPKTLTGKDAKLPAGEDAS